MSEAARSHQILSGDRFHRGQSFVEFALVLPLLLVLLLGIADFARVFQAGIVLEASTRDAAEISAIERLRRTPDTAADPAYYSALRLASADAACAESRRLPTFEVGDSCPDGAHDNAGNTSWFVRICIHDNADPGCDPGLATGYSAPPPGMCDEFEQPMSNAVPVNIASYFVEVRTCYKFETLFNLDITLPMSASLGLGDIWIERTRTFVVDCPVGTDPTDLATVCPNP